MARTYNSRAMTRVEVLVTVLVSGFILSLLPPVFRHAQSDAARDICRAHLAAIGKEMLFYAKDYQEELPRAGGPGTVWGETPNWMGRNRFQAFGLDPQFRGGTATISSCLYLLVKYSPLMPRDFICPGDTGTTEFKLPNGLPPNFELIDAWDFGPEAYKHCSYAYQMPFGLRGLKTTDDPGLAVAADRNPWLQSPAAEAKRIASFKPDLPPFNGTLEQARKGNSVSHREDGQNVLFVDGHVAFQERSTCGLDNDNIYTVSSGPAGGSPVGTVPVFPTVAVSSRKDSILVHDPAPYEGTRTYQAKDIDSRSLRQTAVLATLDCPLPEHENAIWCATFQMAWDKLRRDVIGAPVHLIGAEELAGRLNHARYPAGDIDTESYYVAAGFVKDGIIEQTQKEMAKRFPSEAMPVFDEKYRTLPEVITAYAYLNVDVGFECPYYTYLSKFDFLDSGGARTGVTAFCAETSAPNTDYMRVRDQTEVLYYDYGSSPETAQFAVDLSKKTQPYQVVLARVPRCKTLGEAAKALQGKIGMAVR